MNKGFNKVFLIGHVGKEPKGGDVQGSRYCTFSLATNEGHKDAEGNWVDKTEWHNIVCWKKTAEYVEKYIKTGAQLLIEGKLRTRSWQDKETGKTMYATEIIADSVKSLDKKPSGQQDSADDLPV